MRWRDTASTHLSLLVFAELVVYCILDVWPYATYSLKPMDSGSDPATWVRITALALSGLLIPLVMPRPFRPRTPGQKPGIEDTVSLLSLYSFAFLDGLVIHANKVGDVTLDDLPELVESDKAEYLGKRASFILDRTRNKNGHVMLSTAIIWSKCLNDMRRLLYADDYPGKVLALGGLWSLLQSAAQLTGPFGLKNLLEYVYWL